MQTKKRIPWGERYSLGWKIIIVALILSMTMEGWHRVQNWLAGRTLNDSPIYATASVILFLVLGPPVASFVYLFFFPFPHDTDSDNHAD